jgi:hypothetical protein
LRGATKAARSAWKWKRALATGAPPSRRDRASWLVMLRRRQWLACPLRSDLRPDRFECLNARRERKAVAVNDAVQLFDRHPFRLVPASGGTCREHFPPAFPLPAGEFMSCSAVFRSFSSARRNRPHSITQANSAGNRGAPGEGQAGGRGAPVPGHKARDDHTAARHGSGCPSSSAVRRRCTCTFLVDRT